MSVRIHHAIFIKSIILTINLHYAVFRKSISICIEILAIHFCPAIILQLSGNTISTTIIILSIFIYYPIGLYPSIEIKEIGFSINLLPTAGYHPVFSIVVLVFVPLILVELSILFCTILMILTICTAQRKSLITVHHTIVIKSIIGIINPDHTILYDLFVLRIQKGSIYDRPAIVLQQSCISLLVAIIQLIIVCHAFVFAQAAIFVKIAGSAADFIEAMVCPSAFAIIMR